MKSSDLLPIVNEINQMMYERAHYLKCLVNENSVPIHLRVTGTEEATDTLETASFKSSTTHLMQPGVVHQGNLASSISISNRSGVAAADGATLAAQPNSETTKSTHSNRLKASNQNLNNHSTSQQQVNAHTTETKANKTNPNPNPNPKMVGTDDPALPIIKNILR